MSAEQADTDGSSGGINISASYPKEQQWIHVGKQVISQEVHTAPSIKVTTAGDMVVLSMGDMGVDKHRKKAKSSVISLAPTWHILADEPTKLTW